MTSHFQEGKVTFLENCGLQAKTQLALQNSWEQPVLGDTCRSEGAEGKRRSAEQHLPIPKYPCRLRTCIKSECT